MKRVCPYEHKLLIMFCRTRRSVEEVRKNDGGRGSVEVGDMGFLMVTKNDWRGESDRRGGCSVTAGGMQGDCVVMMMLVVFSLPLCPLLVS